MIDINYIELQNKLDALIENKNNKSEDDLFSEIKMLFAQQQKKIETVTNKCETLTNERENLKTITQTGSIIFDESGNLLNADNIAVEILGDTKKHLKSKPFITLVKGDFKKRFHKHITNIFHSAKPQSCTIEIKKSGDTNECLYLYSVPKVNLQQEVTKCKTFVQLKNREDVAINDKQEKYKDLIHLLPEIIIETDVKGYITFANKKTFELTGYSSKEINNGLNVTQLVIQEDRERVLLDIQKIFQDQELNGVEYTILKSDQTIFPMMVYLNPIKKSTEVIGLRWIIIDISEQKRIQQELILSKEKAEEASRLKTAFLANMSHEVRTPMNGILGFTELLTRENLDIDSRHRYTKLIQISTKQLLSIINDIIDISKLESNQMKWNEKECCVNSILDETLVTYNEEIIEKEKTQIKLSLYKGLLDNESEIIIDGSKLRQILGYLINNGIKFTEKGSVEFGYNLIKQKSDLNLIYHKQNLDLGDLPILQFYVRDTGIGISKEKQKIIFERFRQVDDTYSRQYGGTGLGLSISKGLLDIMNGQIWVDSEKDMGTTFGFSVPYSPCHPEIKKAFEFEQIEDVKFIWNDKTVLIVDDIPIIYAYLNELLSETGAKCIYARSGQIAIDICKTNSDIDIVLMDIQMPGLSGYETTQQLKKMNKNLPIIAQTAYALSDDRDKAIEAGCDDYVNKPLESEILFEKMDALMH